MERMAELAASARLHRLARRGWWLIGILLVAAATAPALIAFATKSLVPPGGATAPPQGGQVTTVAPLVGYQAPNFRLAGLDGKPVELRQYWGHSIVLNFWATWCAPCREEMPELEQIYRQYKDEGGLVVLAVSVDDASSVKQVPGYLRAGDPRVGPYTFPVALDPQQDAVRLYKLAGVPSTYFVDGAGILRAIQPGAMSRQVLLARLRTILTLPDTG